MSESAILLRIRLAVSALGCRLFRFLVGLYYTRNGHPIKIGTPGISDLVGWMPVTITPVMVGKTVPLFCAIEVKSETGRLRKEQTAFLAAVQRAGGIAFVARSAEEAVHLLTVLH